MALGPTITLVDRLGNPFSSLLDQNPPSGFNPLFMQGAITAISGVPISSVNPFPVSEETVGVQLTNSTTLAAAASGSVTLAGVASKTTYLRGFLVSSVNATAAVNGLITVTGTISGTLNFEYTQTTNGSILLLTPTVAIAASAPNTAIVLNFPAITGGSATALSIWGVQI